ncbi:MAG: ABC transporter ATP-binding protein [Arenicella sp.]
MQRFFRFFESRIDPYPDSYDYDKPQNMWQFVWECTKGSRGWLLMLTILSGLMGAFEALMYAWMGSIVDWISQYGADGVAEFWQDKSTVLLLMLVALIVSIVLAVLHAGIHFQTLQGILPMRLRWQFHQRILDQSMSFFNDEMSGRVSAKVMQTALAVRETLMSFTSMFSYMGVYLISSGIILGSLDFLLLLPFLGWVFAFTMSMCFFLPRLRDASTIQADSRSKMTGRITDAYANISSVKLFSHSQREKAFAKEAMQEFLETVHGQMRYVTGVESVNYVINMALIASTLGLGLYLWSNGLASGGVVATTTALSLRIIGMSHWIMWQIATVFENMGVVQDGLNTLLKPVELKDQPKAQVMKVTAGEIAFDNVRFAHTKDNPIFEGLNLNIKAGEKVGIVGRSGAGKSTLVSLLLRFYDVSDGTVSIDKQNIQTVTQESLRAQIGMVTQDTALLHRSVRDNIAYGKPDATDEEIITAAKAAHAHEFIQSLTDSMGSTAYDTLVGERGVKLSGGQRQRVAIARVMLKNAPILLLDEATSALDSEIEEAISQSLHQLMQGKTVIAIAHRLSTIAALDRLIVIDEGKIIEQGSHDALLKANGLYAQLWTRQSGGFLGVE